MHTFNAKIRAVAADKEGGEHGLLLGRDSGGSNQGGTSRQEADTAYLKGKNYTYVTAANFDDVVYGLSTRSEWTVDTETTGLRPYHGDKVFSVQIGDSKHAYYFNITSDEAYKLTADQLHQLTLMFAVPRIYTFHNAKFDLAMLEQSLGIQVSGTLYDSMVAERLLDSTLNGGDLGMAKTAPRYGVDKDDTVKDYIIDNKLYTDKVVPGKKTKVRFMHFDQVPMNLMVPYGCTDITVTASIAEQQRVKIALIDTASPDVPQLSAVVANEMQLVRSIYNMERRGVRVDTDYCRRAIVYEEDLHTRLIGQFAEHAGEEYKSSRLLFERVFASEKDKWVYGKPTKKKGEVNPKFDKDTVATFDHPAAKVMGEISACKSRLDNYLGFLYHVDSRGYLHASFNQEQARTGRFSSSKPNLQNMKKSEDDDLLKEFVVRRAIIPEPGNFLGMIDYDQVEYRLMLEYCNAVDLIKKIRDEGLDVHSATAALAKIPRSKAKNGNFAVLFCAGPVTLAKTIKGSVADAKQLMAAIDAAAPEIKEFSETVRARIRERGYIFNWFGRRLDYPKVYDFKRKEMTRNEYKGINGLIQGGCADIMKIAINRCEEFLVPYRTELRMTIHDELVFEGPRGEEYLLPLLKDIMESVYQWEHIPLTAGIEISYKSLADKEEFDERIHISG